MVQSESEASNTVKWAICSMDQLCSEIGTTPAGLTTSEAKNKLLTYGPNILPEAQKLSLSRKAAMQLRNLFNVLLIYAAALSFITGWIMTDFGSYAMGLIIILVVIISILFSLFQEYRAEQAIEALHKLVPKDIKVRRDGRVVQLPTSQLVPGDVIEMEEGDKVPADARVCVAFELSVDNSILTGESEPQPRTTMADGDATANPMDFHNLILAGSTISSGSGTAMVLCTGSNTVFGQVVGIAHAIEEPLSPLQREIDHAAKLNFIVAVGISFLFLIIAMEVLHLQILDSLLFMIGVMVCLVPEGLQVTLTLSLALSSLALSKRNVVVKRLSAVETLGSTTVICTDKTGTITEGQMTVRKVWSGGLTFDVSGEGYEPIGRISINGQELASLDRSNLSMICKVAALDNRATLLPPMSTDQRKYRWTAVGDSTDAALLVLTAKCSVDPKKMLEEMPRIGMIPFDSNRKMMTSINQSPDGTVTAFVKGAGNEVLARCKEALWGDRTVMMTPKLAGEIRGQIDIFAKEAYRVIALAVRKLPSKAEKYESASIEKSLTFVGLVAILDPPRRDAAHAVAEARNAGIKVVMMTGDHELTASAIARKVGIITSDDCVVVSCERMAEKSDEEVSRILESQEVVFARITPDQKLRVVKILRLKGETVAVTGDGVNDTPALLEADIGIAMGITGTDVARESADMVLLDDNFASIVHGIEIGRSVFDNLKKFIVYVFSHNWAEMLAFIVFILLQTPLPLTVIGVLMIDLMLEIAPSISLTMEPPESGIMRLPPRSRKSRLFDISTMARSCYIGMLIGVVAVLWCFNTWSAAGWSLGESVMADQAIYVKGTTVVLVGIMAGQLGNLFATRTRTRSALTLSLRANRWLLPSLALELILLITIVYLPFTQPLFGTGSIDPVYWAYLFAIAPVILILEEARKYIVRRRAVPASIRIPAPVPLAPSREMVFSTSRIRREPTAPSSPPLLLMGFDSSDIMNALPAAATIAERSSSRLLIAADRESITSIAEKLSIDSGVPIDYIDLGSPKGKKALQVAAMSMRKYAEKLNVEMVGIPVKRRVFARFGGRKAAGWIEEFAGKKVLLISEVRGFEYTGQRPRRLLVPVFDELHPDVFALADALSSSSSIPDVNIVASKVTMMPQEIPLYSIYRPESLMDAEREGSVTKSRGVLYARNLIKGLLDFAGSRQTDMIILRGDWTARGKGYLSKRERRIAAKAPCNAVVLLPSNDRK
jgi:magnesium-transporting ATPase (P-type)